MKQEHFSLKTTDQLQLYAESWLAGSMPRAAIAVIHGLGEHAGRYERLCKAFAVKNLAVYAMDLRGHGRSEGPRGDAPGYDALMSDIRLFVAHINKEHPDLPLFLYGHSLGGNLVLHYAFAHPNHICGIISSSPLFKPAFTPPLWKRALLPIATRCKPDLMMSSGLNGKQLSRDGEVVESYRVDPLVHDRISARFAKAMLSAGISMLNRANQLSIPLLLMHGSDDCITSPAASQQFATNAPPQFCYFKQWPGLRHELHHEPQQQEVFDFAIHWMQSRRTT